MDFGLNEDQETLARYARDFLENECAVDVRPREDGRRHRARPGASTRRWPTSDGWPSRSPRQFGGQGMTYVDLGVLIEEMGRASSPARSSRPSVSPRR